MSYEALSEFRIERERQAKTSHNAALCLLIGGGLIIFFGVFLLYKNNITEGALTSSIGGILKVIGGTIIKFNKDTNDRLDSMQSDLFILYTAKVRYSLIFKINSSEERDKEIQKLILAIGEIKRY